MEAYLAIEATGKPSRGRGIRSDSAPDRNCDALVVLERF
jgi:hypothetical protein